MFLIIDNYDSFVYNLARYLEELNQQVVVIRNDKITVEDIEIISPHGIIISPGPKNPEDCGISVDVIKHFKDKIPILGVCLGHQCIAHAFGGKIIKGEKPIHGKIFSITHDGQGVFNKLEQDFFVTRYHSLEVEKNLLPSCLTITSQTKDGTIMGLRHKNYLIEGVQFHPEAELTQFGHEMLSNFINICADWRSGNGCINREVAIL